MVMLEDFPTAALIFCTDPPNFDPEGDGIIVKHASPPVQSYKPPIKKFNTILKGVCNIMESFTLKGKAAGEDEKLTYLCYNSSLDMKVYAVMPAKKIFISYLHPITTIGHVKVGGPNMSPIYINTRVVKNMPKENSACDESVTDLETVFALHKQYELW